MSLTFSFHFFFFNKKTTTGGYMLEAFSGRANATVFSFVRGHV